MRTPAKPGHSDLPRVAADVLERLRQRRPRVHCITNAVAQSFTANMLLAIGAVPSMTIAAEEVAAFVARADALLVNLGTFDAERRAATDIAVGEALEKQVPWVLDPVFIDRSGARAAYARALAGKRPHAIRLNGAELAALAEGTHEAARYALDHLTIIGLTGATDLVTDGSRAVAISNGHALMDKVTAMGCAASALVAACHAVESDPLLATASGLLAIGVAGEIAGERAKGPGSFAAEIVDAIFELDHETLTTWAKVA